MLAALCGTKATAQGYVSTRYMAESRLKNRDGENLGKGDMLKIDGRYTLPLKVRTDSAGRMTAWTATLRAAFGMMNNSGNAAGMNPDRILNTSINISYTQPLSRRWQLIASAGTGIYAEPDYIRLSSILANGAAIFAYRVNNNLNVGVGLGLTNSFGAPMVIPMGYLDFKTKGKININVDMAGTLKATASMLMCDRLNLELTAIEMEGMSAVIKIDGKTKIYSTTTMMSHIGISYATGRHSSLFMHAGYAWMRTSRTSERSLKGLFNSFSGNSDKLRFAPAPLFSIGYKYSFRQSRK